MAQTSMFGGFMEGFSPYLMQSIQDGKDSERNSIFMNALNQQRDATNGEYAKAMGAQQDTVNEYQKAVDADRDPNDSRSDIDKTIGYNGDISIFDRLQRDGNPVYNAEDYNRTKDAAIKSQGILDRRDQLQMAQDTLKTMQTTPTPSESMFKSIMGMKSPERLGNMANLFVQSGGKLDNKAYDMITKMNGLFDTANNLDAVHAQKEAMLDVRKQLADAQDYKNEGSRAYLESKAATGQQRADTAQQKVDNTNDNTKDKIRKQVAATKGKDKGGSSTSKVGDTIKQDGIVYVKSPDGTYTRAINETPASKVTSIVVDPKSGNKTITKGIGQQLPVTSLDALAAWKKEQEKKQGKN